MNYDYVIVIIMIDQFLVPLYFSKFHSLERNVYIRKITYELRMAMDVDTSIRYV